MDVTCKDCSKPFTITQGELDWLAEKGYVPFKRCKTCRDKRREQAEHDGNIKESSK